VGTENGRREPRNVLFRLPDGFCREVKSREQRRLFCSLLALRLVEDGSRERRIFSSTLLSRLFVSASPSSVVRSFSFCFSTTNDPFLRLSRAPSFSFFSLPPLTSSPWVPSFRTPALQATLRTSPTASCAPRRPPSAVQAATSLPSTRSLIRRWCVLFSLSQNPS
jgi:hypothetical protein